MTDTDDMIVMEEGDVVITAASELVDSSYRAGEEFLWGYYFCIENNSDEKITLLGKNWNITDDSGRSFCDDSDGFSGEIPELEPGEYFEFSCHRAAQGRSSGFLRQLQNLERRGQNCRKRAPAGADFRRRPGTSVGSGFELNVFHKTCLA